MSNLALNRYSPSANRIEKHSNERSCPIWLLINPKYPGAICNVWPPILYAIQDEVYRKLRARIDERKIFIKNVVSDLGIVSNTSNWGAGDIANEHMMLRKSVFEYRPKILISFGPNTYELVRRVFDISPEKGLKLWSATQLGDEFERSIANFDINRTNKIPLLSRVKKSGKFIEDHDHFSWDEGENYFRDVGTKIADRIIENKDSLKIWI